MNCNLCQQAFDRLLDAPTDDGTTARARQHLAECPACAAAWRDYERAWQAFVSSPEIEPSSNFVARVMNQLDAGEREQTAWRWFRLPVWRWAFATAAAIAVLAAGAGFWLKSDRLVDHELIAELPVVQHLDLLTDFDVIDNLDRLKPSVSVEELEMLLSELWKS
ncbi:MAG: zf-HC2 domain-containing protein [Verrucomicrobiae bacterium]|nr:zf-HC2 domain-containing protein [Verrucomicrobiae bacterium]